MEKIPHIKIPGGIPPNVLLKVTRYNRTNVQTSEVRMKEVGNVNKRAMAL